MENSWKPRSHELENESKIRLLETHSHTSERRGNEADKVRKKIKEGRPSLKGQEKIANKCRRHAPRDGGRARKCRWKSGK